MTTLDQNLIVSEETKRLRNWNAAQRWKAIQATIAWAEQQQSVRRNSPARCREIERATLQQIGRWLKTQHVNSSNSTDQGE